MRPNKPCKIQSFNMCNDRFEAGDIVICRNTGESNGWRSDFFKVMQSIPRGQRLGHSQNTHIAICILAQTKTDPAVFAHIDYDASGTKGIPTLNHLDGYAKGNLLIVRAKICPQLPSTSAVRRYQTALAQYALSLYKESCEAGTKFDTGSTSVALSWLRTVTKSLASNTPVSSKATTQKHRKDMACFQFVSEAVTRAIISLRLDHKAIFNVDPDAATTRSIEHTLKTQHRNQYDFYIKPITTSIGSFEIDTSLNAALDLLERIKIPSNVLAPINKLLTNTRSFFELNSIDRVRLLMLYLKQNMTNAEYLPARNIIKKQLAIFDEDLYGISIYHEKAGLLSACLADTKAVIKNPRTCERFCRVLTSAIHAVQPRRSKASPALPTLDTASLREVACHVGSTTSAHPVSPGHGGGYGAGASSSHQGNGAGAGACSPGHRRNARTANPAETAAQETLSSPRA